MDDVHKKVSTTLKWFEPRKGFGFVHHAETNTDAFLHFSALKQAGYETLAPGTTIVCTLGDGPKGKQVSEIESVDESTATDLATQEDSSGIQGPAQAEVKFYNTSKGFGFATVQGEESDVFLPGKLIPYRQEPDTGQMVTVTYRKGVRGFIAVSVKI